MILKSITPNNVGPFCFNSKLEIEEGVTVITGPNDAGKSNLLKAIEFLFSQNPIPEFEINREFRNNLQGTPDVNRNIYCDAVLEFTEASKMIGGDPKGLLVGDIVSVRKFLTVNDVAPTIIEINSIGKTVRQNGITLGRMPRFVRLPFGNDFGELINLVEPNISEKAFLRFCFGDNFIFQQFRTQPDLEKLLILKQAENRINKFLDELLPVGLRFKFHLTYTNDKRNAIGLGIEDSKNGISLFNSRGSGVKKLLNIVLSLLLIAREKVNHVIIFDEPEISLHADSQHFLRRLFEKVTSESNLQIIYSTHSPAMINSFNPRSVRLVERVNQNEKTGSTVINDCFHKNFSLVRLSLGISPADSLLFAPISIIVEGATEFLCFPQIIEKLFGANILDKEKKELFLSNIHLIDGTGDAFEYFCRIAKSHNSRVILFVDGDKQKILSNFKSKHPDVPVIEIQQNKEFEDIVPLSNYIKAISTLLEDNQNINEVNFQTWLQTKKFNKSTMISKLVDTWILDEFGEKFSKPYAMKKAIELTDPGDIVTEPFEKLFHEISLIAEKF